MREGWETKKLSEVCQIKPPKNEARKKLKAKDLVSFLPMEDLGVSARAISAKRERKLEDVDGSYTYFAENDVLLAKITPCFENGKVGIARNLKNGIGFGSSEYLVFRSNGSIIPEYMFYFVSREQFRDEGSKSMTGAVGHKRVSKDFIENYPIPYPKSIPEQQHIVSILDEAFAAIAKAKANAEKNLKNAKELFESYLQGVFVNKGEDWEVKKLGEACNIIMGQSPPGDTYNITGQGTPLINGPVEFGPDPFSKTLMTKFTTSPRKYCKRNDLILCVRGSTTGRMNIAGFDGCVGRGVAAIRYSQNQSWVNYFILASRKQIYDIGTGATFPNVSSQLLYNLAFPLPPSDIQMSIITKFESISTETKKLEAIYHQKLNDLQELKKSILQKAFNGELKTSKAVAA